MTTGTDVSGVLGLEELDHFLLLSFTAGEFSLGAVLLQWRSIP